MILINIAKGKATRTICVQVFFILGKMANATHNIITSSFFSIASCGMSHIFLSPYKSLHFLIMRVGPTRYIKS